MADEDGKPNDRSVSTLVEGRKAKSKTKTKSKIKTKTKSKTSKHKPKASKNKKRSRSSRDHRIMVKCYIKFLRRILKTCQENKIKHTDVASTVIPSLLDIILNCKWSKIAPKYVDCIVTLLGQLSEVSQKETRWVVKDLIEVVKSPWRRSIITAMLHGANDLKIEEVFDLLAKEGLLVVNRIRSLLENNLPKLCLNYLDWVYRCFTWNERPIPNTITLSNKQFIYDIYVILLNDLKSIRDVFYVLKSFNSNEIMLMVDRLRTKHHRSDIAFQVVHMLILKMSINVLEPNEHTVYSSLVSLFCEMSITKQMVDLKKQVNSICKLTSTSDHIYVLARGVYKQFSTNSEMVTFVIELYIRGLTTDANALDKAKCVLKEPETVRELGNKLSRVFQEVASIFPEYELRREFILNAFCVNPCTDTFNILEKLAEENVIPKPTPLPDNCTWHEKSQPGAQLCVMCGGLFKPDDDMWIEAIDEEPDHTKLLDPQKTSLAPHLCDDLNVVLSSTRIQQLHWHLERSEMFKRCRGYIEQYKDLKLMLSKELEYLNIDYNQFKDMPGVNYADDPYAGVEKGYEHFIEFSDEEDDDISNSSRKRRVGRPRKSDDSDGYIPPNMQINRPKKFDGAISRKKFDTDDSSSRSRKSDNDDYRPRSSIGRSRKFEDDDYLPLSTNIDRPSTFEGDDYIPSNINRSRKDEDEDYIPRTSYVGRPKKSEDHIPSSGKVGRPRKSDNSTPHIPKKVGRPRKTDTDKLNDPTSERKKKRNPNPLQAVKDLHLVDLTKSDSNSSDKSKNLNLPPFVPKLSSNILPLPLLNKVPVSSTATTSDPNTVKSLRAFRPTIRKQEKTVFSSPLLSCNSSQPLTAHYQPPFTMPKESTNFLAHSTTSMSSLSVYTNPYDSLSQICQATRVQLPSSQQLSSANLPPRPTGNLTPGTIAMRNYLAQKYSNNIRQSNPTSFHTPLMTSSSQSFTLTTQTSNVEPSCQTVVSDNQDKSKKCEIIPKDLSRTTPEVQMNILNPRSPMDNEINKPFHDRNILHDLLSKQIKKRKVSYEQYDDELGKVKKRAYIRNKRRTNDDKTCLDENGTPRSTFSNSRETLQSVIQPEVQQSAQNNFNNVANTIESTIVAYTTTSSEQSSISRTDLTINTEPIVPSSTVSYGTTSSGYLDTSRNELSEEIPINTKVVRDAQQTPSVQNKNPFDVYEFNDALDSLEIDKTILKIKENFKELESFHEQVIKTSFNSSISQISDEKIVESVTFENNTNIEDVQKTDIDIFEQHKIASELSTDKIVPKTFTEKSTTKIPKKLKKCLTTSNTTVHSPILTTKKPIYATYSRQKYIKKSTNLDPKQSKNDLGESTGSKLISVKNVDPITMKPTSNTYLIEYRKHSEESTTCSHGESRNNSNVDLSTMTKMVPFRVTYLKDNNTHSEKSTVIDNEFKADEKSESKQMDTDVTSLHIHQRTISQNIVSKHDDLTPKQMSTTVKPSTFHLDVLKESKNDFKETTLKQMNTDVDSLKTMNQQMVSQINTSTESKIDVEKSTSKQLNNEVKSSQSVNKQIVSRDNITFQIDVKESKNDLDESTSTQMNTEVKSPKTVSQNDIISQIDVLKEFKNDFNESTSKQVKPPKMVHQQTVLQHDTTSQIDILKDTKNDLDKSTSTQMNTEVKSPQINVLKDTKNDLDESTSQQVKPPQTVHQQTVLHHDTTSQIDVLKESTNDLNESTSKQVKSQKTSDQQIVLQNDTTSQINVLKDTKNDLDESTSKPVKSPQTVHQQTVLQHDTISQTDVLKDTKNDLDESTSTQVKSPQMIYQQIVSQKESTNLNESISKEVKSPQTVSQYNIISQKDDSDLLKSTNLAETTNKNNNSDDPIDKTESEQHSTENKIAVPTMNNSKKKIYEDLDSEKIFIDLHSELSADNSLENISPTHHFYKFSYKKTKKSVTTNVNVTNIKPDPDVDTLIDPVTITEPSTLESNQIPTAEKVLNNPALSTTESQLSEENNDDVIYVGTVKSYCNKPPLRKRLPKSSTEQNNDDDVIYIGTIESSTECKKSPSASQLPKSSITKCNNDDDDDVIYVDTVDSSKPPSPNPAKVKDSIVNKKPPISDETSTVCNKLSSTSLVKVNDSITDESITPTVCNKPPLANPAKVKDSIINKKSSISDETSTVCNKPSSTSLVKAKDSIIDESSISVTSTVCNKPLSPSPTMVRDSIVDKKSSISIETSTVCNKSSSTSLEHSKDLIIEKEPSMSVKTSTVCNKPPSPSTPMAGDSIVDKKPSASIETSTVCNKSSTTSLEHYKDSIIEKESSISVTSTVCNKPPSPSTPMARDSIDDKKPSVSVETSSSTSLEHSKDTTIENESAISVETDKISSPSLDEVIDKEPSTDIELFQLKKLESQKQLQNTREKFLHNDLSGWSNIRYSSIESDDEEMRRIIEKTSPILKETLHLIGSDVITYPDTSNYPDEEDDPRSLETVSPLDVQPPLYLERSIREHNALKRSREKTTNKKPDTSKSSTSTDNAVLNDVQVKRRSVDLSRCFVSGPRPSIRTILASRRRAIEMRTGIISDEVTSSEDSDTPDFTSMLKSRRTAMATYSHMYPPNFNPHSKLETKFTTPSSTGLKSSESNPISDLIESIVSASSILETEQLHKPTISASETKTLGSNTLPVTTVATAAKTEIDKPATSSIDSKSLESCIISTPVTTVATAAKGFETEIDKLFTTSSTDSKCMESSTLSTTTSAMVVNAANISKTEVIKSFTSSTDLKSLESSTSLTPVATTTKDSKTEEIKPFITTADSKSIESSTSSTPVVAVATATKETEKSNKSLKRSIDTKEVLETREPNKRFKSLTNSKSLESSMLSTPITTVLTTKKTLETGKIKPVTNLTALKNLKSNKVITTKKNLKPGEINKPIKTDSKSVETNMLSTPITTVLTTKKNLETGEIKPSTYSIGSKNVESSTFSTKVLNTGEINKPVKSLTVSKSLEFNKLSTSVTTNVNTSNETKQHNILLENRDTTPLNNLKTLEKNTLSSSVDSKNLETEKLNKPFRSQTMVVSIPTELMNLKLDSNTKVVTSSKVVETNQLKPKVMTTLKEADIPESSKPVSSITNVVNAAKIETEQVNKPLKSFINVRTNSKTSESSVPKILVAEKVLKPQQSKTLTSVTKTISTPKITCSLPLASFMQIKSSPSISTTQQSNKPLTSFTNVLTALKVSVPQSVTLSTVTKPTLTFTKTLKSIKPLIQSSKVADNKPLTSFANILPALKVSVSQSATKTTSTLSKSNKMQPSKVSNIKPLTSFANILPAPKVSVAQSATKNTSTSSKSVKSNKIQPSKVSDIKPLTSFANILPALKVSVAQPVIPSTSVTETISTCTKSKKPLVQPSKASDMKKMTMPLTTFGSSLRILKDGDEMQLVSIPSTAILKNSGKSIIVSGITNSSLEAKPSVSTAQMKSSGNIVNKPGLSRSILKPIVTSRKTIPVTSTSQIKPADIIPVCKTVPNKVVVSTSGTIIPKKFILSKNIPKSDNMSTLPTTVSTKQVTSDNTCVKKLYLTLPTKNSPNLTVASTGFPTTKPIKMLETGKTYMAKPAKTVLVKTFKSATPMTKNMPKVTLDYMATVTHNNSLVTSTKGTTPSVNHKSVITQPVTSTKGTTQSVNYKSVITQPVSSTKVTTQSVNHKSMITQPVTKSTINTTNTVIQTKPLTTFTNSLKLSRESEGCKIGNPSVPVVTAARPLKTFSGPGAKRSIVKPIINITESDNDIEIITIIDPALNLTKKPPTSFKNVLKNQLINKSVVTNTVKTTNDYKSKSSALGSSDNIEIIEYDDEKGVKQTVLVQTKPPTKSRHLGVKILGVEKVETNIDTQQFRDSSEEEINFTVISTSDGFLEVKQTNNSQFKIPKIEQVRNDTKDTVIPDLVPFSSGTKLGKHKLISDNSRSLGAKRLKENDDDGKSSGWSSDTDMTTMEQQNILQEANGAISRSSPSTNNVSVQQSNPTLSSVVASTPTNIIQNNTLNTTNGGTVSVVRSTTAVLTSSTASSSSSSTSTETTTPTLVNMLIHRPTQHQIRTTNEITVATGPPRLKQCYYHPISEELLVSTTTSTIQSTPTELKLVTSTPTQVSNIIRATTGTSTHQPTTVRGTTSTVVSASGTPHLLSFVNSSQLLKSISTSDGVKPLQLLYKISDGKTYITPVSLQSSVKMATVNKQQTGEIVKVEVISQPTKLSTSNNNMATVVSSSAARSIFEETYAKFIHIGRSNTTTDNITSSVINATTANTSSASSTLPKFQQAFGKTTNFSNSTTRVTNTTNEAQHQQPLLLVSKMSNTNVVASSSSSPNVTSSIITTSTSSPITVVPVSMGNGGLIMSTSAATSTIQRALSTNTVVAAGNQVRLIKTNQNTSTQQSVVTTVKPLDNKNDCDVDSNASSDSLPPSSNNNTVTIQQGGGQQSQTTVLTPMRLALPIVQRSTGGGIPTTRVMTPVLLRQRVLLTSSTVGTPIRLPQNARVLASNMNTLEPAVSSSTLEQLREFDKVFEKVKERSTTVQPTANNSTSSTVVTPSTTVTTVHGSDSSPVVTNFINKLDNSNNTSEDDSVASSNNNNNNNNRSSTPIMATFQAAPHIDTSNLVVGSQHQQQRVSVAYVSGQLGQTILSSPVVVMQQQPASAPSPALSITSQSSSSSPSSSNNNPISSSKPSINKTITAAATKTIKNKPIKPNTASPLKASPVPKPQQKPQEDEGTAQRIYSILAEYAEQLRNSPDLNNKPAPRRRSNPPANPSQNSKRKKSSGGKKVSTGGSSVSGMEMSPGAADDHRTIGSEDSSCGVLHLSQLQDSPSQAMLSMDDAQSTEESMDIPGMRGLHGDSNDCIDRPSSSQSASATSISIPTSTCTTQHRQLILTDASNSTGNRNVIITDSVVSEALAQVGKITNAATVLVPGNYLLPMSMVKGGHQITIVSGGSKILAVKPLKLPTSMSNNSPGTSQQITATQVLVPTAVSTTNAQKISTQILSRTVTSSETNLIRTQPIVSGSVGTLDTNVRDNCNNLDSNLSFNSTTAVLTVQSSNSKINTTLSETNTPRNTSHQLQLSSISQVNDPTTISGSNGPLLSQLCELTETGSHPSSIILTDGSNVNSNVINVSPIHNGKVGRDCIDNSKSSFKKNWANNSISDTIEGHHHQSSGTSPVFRHSPGMQYASVDSNQPDKKRATIIGTTGTVTNAKLSIQAQRKQAAIERELRLQKSLSEECEDLGVDEPSASDLFPEAEILFENTNQSPSFGGNVLLQDVVTTTCSNEDDDNIFSNTTLDNGRDITSSQDIKLTNKISINDHIDYLLVQKNNKINKNGTTKFNTVVAQCSNSSQSSYEDTNTLITNTPLISDVTIPSPLPQSTSYCLPSPYRAESPLTQATHSHLYTYSKKSNSKLATKKGRSYSLFESDCELSSSSQDDTNSRTSSTSADQKDNDSLSDSASEAAQSDNNTRKYSRKRPYKLYVYDENGVDASSFTCDKDETTHEPGHHHHHHHHNNMTGATSSDNNEESMSAMSGDMMEGVDDLDSSESSPHSILSDSDLASISGVRRASKRGHVRKGCPCCTTGGSSSSPPSKRKFGKKAFSQHDAAKKIGGKKIS